MKSAPLISSTKPIEATICGQLIYTTLILILYIAFTTKILTIHSTFIVTTGNMTLRHLLPKKFIQTTSSIPCTQTGGQTCFKISCFWPAMPTLLATYFLKPSATFHIPHHSSNHTPFENQKSPFPYCLLKHRQPHE